MCVYRFIEGYFGMKLSCQPQRSHPESQLRLDSSLGATRHFTLELNDLSSLCVPGSKLQEGYDSLGCC